MSPAVIAGILALVEEAIKDAPQIAETLKAVFAKQNPTPADWKAAREAVLAKKYEDFAPPIQG